MIRKALTRRHVSQISPETTTSDQCVRAREVMFSSGSGWGLVTGAFRASWWCWFSHNTHRKKLTKSDPTATEN
uniref:Putative ovule protein n=1 Tax=Solanum chacoense TaxID=4108 RepID=A0A0V0GMF8_SOLCH